ncbi:cell division protein FtsL [Sinobacterium norvegicum]|nr:cell division protein FtsL [Sinobacterium norvegicum]
MTTTPSTALLNSRRFSVPLLMVLLLVNVASALAVVYSTHWNRQLFGELQVVQREAVAIEAEWGRLLLENSSLGAYARIESIARKQLSMKQPSIEETVLVKQ